MPSSSSIFAIASLSLSVKSTPLVCAPSRSVVSYRYRRSRVIMRSQELIRDVERDRRCDDDQRIFEHDVIQPMPRERRVGPLNLGPGRGFRSVLLAHRATSQVVPSLESLSTIPIAPSSSRIRSASLKFLAVRAALRAVISDSILDSSIPPR